VECKLADLVQVPPVDLSCALEHASGTKLGILMESWGPGVVRAGWCRWSG
jgi:hypothetical protein